MLSHLSGKHTPYIKDKKRAVRNKKIKNVLTITLIAFGALGVGYCLYLAFN